MIKSNTEARNKWKYNARKKNLDLSHALMQL